MAYVRTFEEMAYMRTFEETALEADEKILGMQKYKWRCPNPCDAGAYELVQLQSITQPVFMQPHPAKNHEWFYNYFV